MVQQNPIICHSCKQNTGFDFKDFRYYVMTSDIKCPHCGVVVLKAPPRPMLSSSPANWTSQVSKFNKTSSLCL